MKASPLENREETYHGSRGVGNEAGSSFWYVCVWLDEDYESYRRGPKDCSGLFPMYDDTSVKEMDGDSW